MDLDYGDWRAGAHGVGIHRAVLFDTLHDVLAAAGVTVITGARIVRIENHARPILHAEDGRAFGAFDLALVGTVRPRPCAPRSAPAPRRRSIPGARCG
jgi:hypothetical protein